MPTIAATTRALPTHQAQLLAVAAGAAVHDILAAVTPGGGKLLLPVLAAHTLIEAGVVERVVCVVPRDSLRLQAEEAFAEPHWREALGHSLAARKPRYWARDAHVFSDLSIRLTRPTAISKLSTVCISRSFTRAHDGLRTTACGVVPDYANDG